MYQITELLRPAAANASYGPRLFFTIYYRVDDNAFKLAAQTWEKDVKAQDNFVAGVDTFYSREIYTENDFRIAWKEIGDKAKTGGLQVWAGHILTHASKQTDSNDGLEFHSEGDDGTLKQDEIMSLTKLPWADYGYLILGGCNTGLAGQRGWTPAAAFAHSQGVPTLGQKGFAYFSEAWTTYDEKEADDVTVCLWAYDRARNASGSGSGGRILGQVYK